jgi:hypothetical protein
MSEQSESVEQQIERLTQQYAQIALERCYMRHGGQPEKFPEFWQRAKKSEILLTEDNRITINGRLPDFFVGDARRSPEIEQHFFNWAERSRTEESTEAPQSQPSQAATTSQATAEPDVLYVSRVQIADRRFMRSVPEITAAIQEGRVKVDDDRAVRDVAELKSFLTPKQAEPAPKVEPKQAPKRTTEVTQAQAVDRRFLRQVEQEWASEGGYLKNVSNGNIRIV